MESVRSFHLLVFTSSRPFGLIIFDLIFREKVVGMKRAHPRASFRSEFDASYLLQLSISRFFRVNGKQLTDVLRPF